MDDGWEFLIWVLATFLFSILVLAIMDCIERRQRRLEDEAAIGAAVATEMARADGAAAIVREILDYVSLPRQHQPGGAAAAAAGDGSRTATERPECVFCLGELEDEENAEEWIVLKTCRHEFHRKCMAKWILQKKSSCPTCRALVWPDVLPETPPLADMV
nr:E3 ubiquitin-protein ligase EL5-like [Lolium perenne]